MKKIFSSPLIQSALALAGIALIAGTPFAPITRAYADDHFKPSALNLKVDESPLHRDQGLKSSYAPIVQSVAPSVVKIFVTSSVPKSNFPYRI
ncbi:MAG: hypothetical protein WB586_15755 [Chthoniobacterales bacterium]